MTSFYDNIINECKNNNIQNKTHKNVNEIISFFCEKSRGNSAEFFLKMNEENAP